MHSTARSMPAPAHEFDAPDLLQLLGAKGLAHWHRPLLLLLSRYAGWLSHYEFDPTLDPDLRPLGEVIAVLASIAGPAGTASVGEQPFAAALSARCDFLSRSALDRASRARWEPLSQSYRDFLIQYPDAEPLWGTEAPWPALELVAWVQAQAAAPDASGAPGASSPSPE